MKDMFRFVGTECDVGHVKLNRFGQRVELERDFAPVAQRGGAALLSESQFQQIGFTDEDLKVWSNPFIDLNEVPADPDEAERKAAFIARRAEAQQMYCAIRDGLLAGNKTGVTPSPVREFEPGE